MNCMIGLEALGHRPDSAILSVGAASFDNFKVIDKFYSPISLDSCIKNDMTVDAEAILWRVRQSHFVRNETLIGEKSIYAVMSDLMNWMSSLNMSLIWCEKPSLNLTILRRASNRVGIDPIWYHDQERCFSTVKSIYPKIEVEKPGLIHQSIHDAVYNANYLLALKRENGLEF